jgi:16S rRNA (guanine527-N7)-methyltransferase
VIVSDLNQAAAELGVDLNDRAVQRLEDYLALLAKWNKVYNLTAIRDPALWVSHHLLDSLSLVKHLSDGSMIDVGSGAGLPGLPVAIACPSRQVVLLDSNQKKCAFLRQVVAELRLDNVSVVNSRVEDYCPEQRFAVVASRAFSDLSEFVVSARHLCASGGRMVAMKGIYPHEEIALLTAGRVERVQRVCVPTLAAERHLVFVDPATGD